MADLRGRAIRSYDKQISICGHFSTAVRTDLVSFVVDCPAKETVSGCSAAERTVLVNSDMIFLGEIAAGASEKSKIINFLQSR